jgi:hypothetical protein
MARVVISGRLMQVPVIDWSRPFVLSIPQHGIDGFGRPLRGINTQYDYDDKEKAVADYRTLKKAGMSGLLLLHFVEEGKTVVLK